LKLSLSRKITLLVMTVLFALVVLTVAFLGRWTRIEVYQRLSAELATADHVASEFMRQRVERLQALCAATAGAARFRAAIDETDKQTILDTGRDEMKLVGADLLLVTDGEGAELAQIAPSKLAVPKDAVAAALAGRGSGDLWVLAGALYQVATEPIAFAGSKPSGTLTLGRRVDDALAKELARLTATGVVMLADGAVVAAADGADLAQAAAKAAPTIPAGESVRTRLVADQEYMVRALKRDAWSGTGRVVARVILLRSLDEALAYLGQIQLRLLVASALVSLVGLGLSLFLGRRITTPLQSLMRSTLEVQAGNYDAPVRVESSDEIGLLAARFDEMRASLRTNIEKLVEEERMRGQMEVERLRALSQMVAGVAHEINTPLGIVNQAASIFTETLSPSALDDLAKDEDARTNLEDLSEAARLIQANIARANQLIQSFKNLSVRQVTDKKETVDLRGLVDEILSLFAINAKMSKLAVTVVDRLPPDRTWTGYPGYLSQVLMNLLTNVERYAYKPGQGGPIEVILEPAELDGKPAWSLAVTDSGAGIPAENLSKVFEVFFTTGRGKGGSGLGLAIVDNLVRSAMHGKITVASTEGQGATFTVVVPRAVEGDVSQG
jgi:signal transduction histidine kinase